jgi:2-alkenal reductase
MSFRHEQTPTSRGKAQPAPVAILRQSVRAAVILLVLLLAACDGGASVYGGQTPISPSTPIADLPVSAAAQTGRVIPTLVPETIISAADAEYLLMTNLYERIAPSVVNIEVLSRSQQPNVVSVSGGSGWVYDTQGHIITNAHVVAGAGSVTITFNDGYVTQAELVGSDDYSDIAVLRVNAPADRLLPLSLGNSDRLRVGQRAVTIGNPFGLKSSMTSGIISGLGRILRSAELIGNMENAAGFQNPAIIQIDAQINPGNSGGPLLNSQGEVIGVNTAIRSSSGIFEGVAFAVPSNTVGRVVPELIEAGRVNYPWIGISARGSEDGLSVPGLAEPLNLPVRAGVLVSAVTRNSPADKAGIRGGSRWTTVRGERVCVGGDIVVAVDGQYVDDIDELVAYMVVNSSPGDTVTLRVVRGEETFDVPVVLEERPNTADTPLCGNL